ncbi:MAG: 5-(carboxyamino)imidazole ribonucleotide mutase [Leptospira sp.]|nr:5-(carboxyamino)imidazole ribonucleotide mutase [Leptospira sp.]
MSENVAQVAVIMGSISDWDTMKEACIILEKFNISFTKNIVSAHRTPEYMVEFAKSARSKGYQVIIAGAGGAAHLPGMVASLTTLPVLGVPVQSKALSGVDSLHSIVQMPKGVPVGTLAIGSSGAANAGLLAARILSLQSEELAIALNDFVEAQKKEALSREGEMEL